MRAQLLPDAGTICTLLLPQENCTSQTWALMAGSTVYVLLTLFGSTGRRTMGSGSKGRLDPAALGSIGPADDATPILGLYGLRASAGLAKLLGLALVCCRLEAEWSDGAAARDRAPSSITSWSWMQLSAPLFASIGLAWVGLAQGLVSLREAGAQGGADRNLRLMQLAGGWAIDVPTAAGPGALVTLVLWALRADGYTAAGSAAASAFVIAVPVAAQVGLLALVLTAGAVFVSVRDENSTGVTIGIGAGVLFSGILCVASALLPGLAGPWLDGGDGVLSGVDWWAVLAPAIALCIAVGVAMIAAHAHLAPGAGRWRVLAVDAAYPLAAGISLCLAAESLNAGWSPFKPGSGPEAPKDSADAHRASLGGVSQTVPSDAGQFRPVWVFMPLLAAGGCTLIHDLVLLAATVLTQGSCIQEDPMALARGEVRRTCSFCLGLDEVTSGSVAVNSTGGSGADVGAWAVRVGATVDAQAARQGGVRTVHMGDGWADAGGSDSQALVHSSSKAIDPTTPLQQQ